MVKDHIFALCFLNPCLDVNVMKYTRYFSVQSYPVKGCAVCIVHNGPVPVQMISPALWRSVLLLLQSILQKRDHQVPFKNILLLVALSPDWLRTSSNLMFSRSYACVRGDDLCQVNSITRTNCKRCRYARCLAVGMKPELVGATISC